jgi:hypoxanthine phosphoribosyltransferase
MCRVPDPTHRVLIPRTKIAARVKTLGRLITRHYRGRRPVLLGVMNGALFFLADLVRAVDLETEISCLRLASYAGTKSTGRVRGLSDLRGSVRGREVLIVDDILDTGRTLAALTAKLQSLGAADVKSCVLLEKRRRRAVPVRADWIGFPIRDEFVIGYGLDFNGRYRGLKEIRVLSPSENASSR